MKSQVKKYKGYWTKCDKRPKSSKFVCSHCHEICSCIHYITKDNKKINVCNYKFCPNCGIEMLTCNISNCTVSLSRFDLVSRFVEEQNSKNPSKEILTILNKTIHKLYNTEKKNKRGFLTTVDISIDDFNKCFNC